MKKLLLTLGTVAAVAAPVASVVACGESTELQTPEFQQLSVAGVTFADAKTPYVVTKLKGFVFVTTNAGGTFLVPSKDVKVTPAVKADPNAKPAVKPEAAKTEITGDSAKTVTDTVKSVIKDTHVILVTKDQKEAIEKGKASAVTVLKTVGDAQTFIDSNQIAADTPTAKKLIDHDGSKAVSVVLLKDGTPDTTKTVYVNPLKDAATLLFNDIFKKQATAEADVVKLAAAKKAAAAAVSITDVAKKAAALKAIEAATTPEAAWLAQLNAGL